MGATLYDPPTIVPATTSAPISASGDVTIANKFFSGGTVSIDLTNVRNVVIRECMISGGGNIRITGVQSGGSITVERCVIANVNGFWLSIEGGGGANFAAHPVFALIIRGNRISDAGGTYIAQGKADITRQWAITHNKFKDLKWQPSATGFLQLNFVSGFSNSSRCIMVANNISHQPRTSDGIHGTEDHVNLSESSGVEIRWNKIFGGVGINSVSGSAIMVGDISQTLSHLRGSNVLVRENICVAPHVGGAGVNFWGGANMELSRNIVIAGQGSYVGLKCADGYIKQNGANMSPLVARDNWICGFSSIAGASPIVAGLQAGHNGGGTDIPTSLLAGWATNVTGNPITEAALGIGANLEDYSLDSTYFDALGMSGGSATTGGGGGTGGGSGALTILATYTPGSLGYTLAGDAPAGATTVAIRAIPQAGENGGAPISFAAVTVSAGRWSLNQSSSTLGGRWVFEASAGGQTVSTPEVVLSAPYISARSPQIVGQSVTITADVFARTIASVVLIDGAGNLDTAPVITTLTDVTETGSANQIRTLTAKLNSISPGSYRVAIRPTSGGAGGTTTFAISASATGALKWISPASNPATPADAVARLNAGTTRQVRVRRGTTVLSTHSRGLASVSGASVVCAAQSPGAGDGDTLDAEAITVADLITDGTVIATVSGGITGSASVGEAVTGTRSDVMTFTQSGWIADTDLVSGSLTIDGVTGWVPTRVYNTTRINPVTKLQERHQRFTLLRSGVTHATAAVLAWGDAQRTRVVIANSRIDGRPALAASTTCAVGDEFVLADGYVWRCTVAGNVGATIPTAGDLLTLFVRPTNAPAKAIGAATFTRIVKYTVAGTLTTPSGSIVIASQSIYSSTSIAGLAGTAYPRAALPAGALPRHKLPASEFSLTWLQGILTGYSQPTDPSAADIATRDTDAYTAQYLFGFWRTGQGDAGLDHTVGPFNAANAAAAWNPIAATLTFAIGATVGWLKTRPVQYLVGSTLEIAHCGNAPDKSTGAAYRGTGYANCNLPGVGHFRVISGVAQTLVENETSHQPDPGAWVFALSGDPVAEYAACANAGYCSLHQPVSVRLGSLGVLFRFQNDHLVGSGRYAPIANLGGAAAIGYDSADQLRGSSWTCLRYSEVARFCGRLWNVASHIDTVVLPETASFLNKTLVQAAPGSHWGYPLKLVPREVGITFAGTPMWQQWIFTGVMCMCVDRLGRAEFAPARDWAVDGFGDRINTRTKSPYVQHWKPVVRGGNPTSWTDQFSNGLATADAVFDATHITDYERTPPLSITDGTTNVTASGINDVDRAAIFTAYAAANNSVSTPTISAVPKPISPKQVFTDHVYGTQGMPTFFFALQMAKLSGRASGTSAWQRLADRVQPTRAYTQERNYILGNAYQNWALAAAPDEEQA